MSFSIVLNPPNKFTVLMSNKQGLQGPPGQDGAVGPIAALSLLGNNTNANGTPSALTPSQVVAMLDVPTNSAMAAALTWANIASKPSTFAPSAHTHTISDLPVGTTTGTIAAGDDSRIVNALSVAAAALAYAPLGHTHSLSQLTQSGAASGQVVAWNGSAWVPTTISSGGGTWGSITGTLSAQSDLNTALNARLAVASNLSDLANAATARTNLGLGNVENAAASGLYVGLTGSQTIAGAKTFSGIVTLGSSSYITYGGGNDFYQSGAIWYLKAAGTLGFAYSASGVALTPNGLIGSAATSALSIVQAWNTTGNPAMCTLSATNTASGSTSKFISCLAGAAGATEVFYVDKNGTIAGRDGSYNSPTVRAISGGYLWLNGNTGAFVGSSGATALNWDANNGYLSVGGGDTNRICADAGDVTALRRGTNAQTFRFYSTYADGSNYGRGSLSASSTAITLAAESLGTGPANVDIVLTPKGTGKVNFSGTGTSWVFDNSSSGITRFMYGGGTNSVYQADWSGNFTFQANIKLGWSYIAGAGNTVDLYFAREGANSLGAGTLGIKNNSGGYAGVTAGVVTSNFQSLSANPSTVDLTASQSRLVKNTTSGVLSLWANDGGTMKSAPLT